MSELRHTRSEHPPKMHADEVETDASLAGRLLAAQFPHWTDLRIQPQRAVHLHARPQVSATYVEGDQAPCMIVHGVAREVGPDHPFFTRFDKYVRDLYGVAIDFREGAVSGSGRLRVHRLH